MDMQASSVPPEKRAKTASHTPVTTASGGMTTASGDVTAISRGVTAASRGAAPGFGANSRTPSIMLSAGDHGVHTQPPPNEEDSNSDWSKLGAQHIKDINDFDLVEWLIGHCITLKFRKAFFPDAKSNGPFKGFVHNTTTDPVPRARVWMNK